MKKALKVGDYASILFLDHAMHSGDQSTRGPVSCEVVGRVSKVTKKHYELLAWICEQDINSQDDEGFSIIRSTITSIKVLT